MVNSGEGQGAGAQENRGQEGYGSPDGKGREVGDLRGWEAGEKCERLIFLVQHYALNSFKNKNPKYI